MMVYDNASSWVSPAPASQTNGLAPQARSTGAAASRWASPQEQRPSSSSSSASYHTSYSHKSNFRPNGQRGSQQTSTRQSRAHPRTFHIPNSSWSSSSSSSDGSRPPTTSSAKTTTTDKAIRTRLPSSSDSIIGSFRYSPANSNVGGDIDPMALLASPSRGIDSTNAASLGQTLDQDLTYPPTQERFREYISKKIKAHCARFPMPIDAYAPKLTVPGQEYFSAKAKDGTARQEELVKARVSLEELLLMVRKLREGIMSSRRLDKATIEVYHLSLFLSILTLNGSQLSTSMERLMDSFPLISVSESAWDASWNFSLAQDFAMLQGQDSPLLNQLRYFSEDNEEIRAHTASFLLLSFTCLGSGSIGSKDSSVAGPNPYGSFQSEKLKALKALHLENSHVSQLPPAIAVACHAETAIRTNDVQRLRSQVLPKATAWQKLLLYRAIPGMRIKSWETLKKGWMSVPLPILLDLPPSPMTEEADAIAKLAAKMDNVELAQEEEESAEENDDWLERLLLIDIGLVPISEKERSQATNKISNLVVRPMSKEVVVPQTAPSPPPQERVPSAERRRVDLVPEEWDDSTSEEEELTTVSQDNLPKLAGDIHCRVARLAACFETHCLPTSIPLTKPPTSAKEALAAIQTRSMAGQIPKIFLDKGWEGRLSFVASERQGKRRAAMKLR